MTARPDPATFRRGTRTLSLRRSRSRVWCCGVIGALGTAASLAQDAGPGSTDIMEMESLADLSIEQLLNEPVTTVSRNETRWMATPAAITVLTNDDIRRSGATTLVEALRMVPGMNVGMATANQSAVSIRGFNGILANKLLVQIDGRSVYNPVFSGVNWDQQHVMLEDVERIEVIRGPGGSVWGANAVNGVVSVVSKSARDTQGGLIFAGGGNVHEMMTGARYGGKIGESAYYRVFSSYREDGELLHPAGGGADDGWRSSRTGFRVDHYGDPDTHLTWQGSVSTADYDNGAMDTYDVHSLARWTRRLRDDSEVELQVYGSRSAGDDYLAASGGVDTFDVDGRHTFRLGGSHQVTWGLGYRLVSIDLEQSNPALMLLDGTHTQHLFSAFAQDEIELVPDTLAVTAGLKIEHNDYTGVELHPTLRAVFTPTENQTLWAAASHSVRTPSALEGHRMFALATGNPMEIGGQWYLPRAVGWGGLQSEVLWAYEAGYRLRPVSWMTWSITGFYNHYSDLIDVSTTPTMTPGVPVGTIDFPLANVDRGTTYGGETSLTLAPAEGWRLIASYALLMSDVPVGPLQPNGFPTHQAMLRSSHDLGARTDLDVQLRYVDEMAGAPSYFTADVRLAYRPRPGLELALVGQNLLDPHPEQGFQPLVASHEVPRGVYARVTWTF